jgi:NAD+ kinase
VSDEAEDDGFDINDSSPEAAECSNTQTRSDQAIGKEKAAEVLAESRPRFSVDVPDDEVTFTRVRESRSRSRLGERSRSRPGTRSRSRSGQSTSGVETPGRYAGPRPNPPRSVHPRSNLPAIAVKSSSSSPSSTDSLSEDATRHGAWDDVRTPHYAHLSSRSQILHEKDVKAESMNLATPVAREAMRRGHTRSVSADHHHPRAFAVWGQDESDSNASDSDA